jgi:HTH-type transcriptional regulator, sugar sensing transcriptional regulator
MESLVEELKKLHFTDLEASIYITLISHRQLNGSQIAKLLHISRSSVYAALEKLKQKGVIFLLPGDQNIYKAQDPATLVETLTSEFIESARIVKEKFSDLEVLHDEDQYWNISGYKNFIQKTKELISRAKQEIYMNTNLDLLVFKKELLQARKKNVRIILFSFEELDTEDLSIEYYSQHDFYRCPDKRMMLVIDNKHSLIANATKTNDVIGTFTSNSLLVSIVAEHIHHDIYLMKLREKYKTEIVTNDIQLGTLNEEEWNTYNANKF